MIIISGHFRGMKLTTSAGNKTRPTRAKVREAIMSSLGPKLQESIFIDLFAGSGAMGIEALSRDCKNGIFIEEDSKAYQAIRKNIENMQARAQKNGLQPPQTQLLRLDVAKAWKGLAELDPDHPRIIWADPPYGDTRAWCEFFVKQLPKISTPGTIFVWEMPSEDVQNLENLTSSWTLLRQKQYGKTTVVMWEFQKKE